MSEGDVSNGFLLIYESKNTADSWDTWHATVEEAERQALEELGISKEEWQMP